VADFSPAQVADLYGQHTAETGQRFSAEALVAMLRVAGARL